MSIGAATRKRLTAVVAGTPHAIGYKDAPKPAKRLLEGAPYEPAASHGDPTAFLARQIARGLKIRSRS